MSGERGIITTYASGVDVVFEWKIKNFFNLPEWDGEIYYSPEFSFGSERWSLFIWPNGVSRNGSSGHVNLALWKRYSDCSIKQSFSLSLKTVAGGNYNKQRFTKCFGGNYSSRYILKRFIPRSELSSRRFEFTPEGALTVICTMESSTFNGCASNIASAFAECRHCKGIFHVDRLSSHQKKCMHRSIKCPDCLEVVMLQT